MKLLSQEVLKILSSVSSEIAQGEIMQLQFVKQVDMVEKNYLDIISAKTASLFGASMRVGGCINDRSNKEKEALESYGRNLGICFQITDDILVYSSKEKVLIYSNIVIEIITDKIFKSLIIKRIFNY